MNPLSSVIDATHGRGEPDARRLLHRFLPLVDQTYGIVTVFAEEQDYFHDEPKWPMWRAEIGPTRLLSPGGYVRTVANGGRGFDLAAARVGAMFEAFERYNLALPDASRHVRASETELISRGESCLSVAEFLSYDTAARDDRRTTAERDRIRDWVEGRRSDGEPLLVPAQFVFVPFRETPEEPLLRDPLTTGAAAGLHRGAAIVRGMLEAVERDGVMRLHYGALPAEAIDPAPLVLDRELAALRRHQLGVQAVRIGSPFAAHVVAVLVTDRTGGRPRFTTGSCARLTLREAVLGALMEAVVYRRALRARLPGPADCYTAGIAADGIRCLEDRAFYWQQDETTGHIDYLPWTPAGAADGSVEYDPVDLLRSIEAAGPVAYVDLGSPELTAAGVRTVKVVAPRLQPMYLNEELECVAAGTADSGWARPAHPHPFL
ncbi:YcaO-like family protein [Dactylosporangium sp. CA-139114]|uniref:YcaO-like family protein n=1 Tax=Dactylosporangium sp. CA-139114 TaxID=3239931 RepID=UPI003D98B890